MIGGQKCLFKRPFENICRSEIRFCQYYIKKTRGRTAESAVPTSCRYFFTVCCPVVGSQYYFTWITRYLLVLQKMSGFVMRKTYWSLASVVSE